jgi:hypothetical protein
MERRRSGKGWGNVERLGTEEGSEDNENDEERSWLRKVRL